MCSGVRLGIGGVCGGSSAIDGKMDEIFKEAGGRGLWRSIIGDKVVAGFVRPQVQVIVFGLRSYITERIGLNEELGFGSPYFASIGLNYRIGGL